MNEKENLSSNAVSEQQGHHSFSAALFEYVELFAWAVFVVMVVFTFAFRICRVEGPSMENTLKQNQTLLLRSAFYTPKQDDIIVFHLTENMDKTLVKRVIACGGQELVIDTNTKTITVDGVVYADTHKVLKDPYSDALNNFYNTGLFSSVQFSSISGGVYRTTVPEGHVFVMGDNRNNSNDSRGPSVGFVDERCILGGVVLRFSPFTAFH